MRDSCRRVLRLLVPLVFAADAGIAPATWPVCPHLEFVPVAAGNAPAITGMRRDEAAPPVGARPGPTNAEAYQGLLGTTYVALRGDRRVSGAALDLAHPETGWRTIPALDR